MHTPVSVHKRLPMLMQVFAGLCVLTVAACSPIVDDRGHRWDTPVNELVTLNVTTRDEVREKLGSPSTQSTFGDETWYYINAVKKSRGILSPEITEQQVTRIVFDASGVVASMNQYNLKDGQNISIVTRETPTEGHSLGFVEQIMGNIGRFNKGSSGSVTDNRRGRK
jgi:outer membrane protein assembly factor BamE (lipoprotein component of BamABCDE complex)